MKQQVTILIWIFLTGILSACSGDSNETINYAEYTFPFKNDVYMEGFADRFKENSIDQETFDKLKLNQLTYQRIDLGDTDTEEYNIYFHDQLRQATPDQIAAGGLFYKNKNGRIERIYLLNDAPPMLSVAEILISYNNEGEIVDSKLVSASGSHEISHEVVDNIIHIVITHGGESWSEGYTIQPDLTLPKTHKFRMTFEEFEKQYR